MMSRAAEIAQELRLFAADEFLTCAESYKDAADYTNMSPEAQVECFLAEQLAEITPKLERLIARIAERVAAHEAREAEAA